jgi:ATP-dependent DNA ligase
MDSKAFKEVLITDAETIGNWKLPILYKTSKIGANISWEIAFDESKENLIMRHGQVGGIITEDFSKVEPKVNRTLQEQAFQEAKRKYINKVRSTYCTLTSSLGTERVMIKVMKSNKYTDKDKEKLNLPVDTEPKIDGTRCWISRVNGKVEYMSRSNIPFSNLEHLTNEFNSIFDYLSTGTCIDTELFSPEYNFQELQSITRTSRDDHLLKGGRKVHPLMGRIVTMIHDMYTLENPPSEIRRQTMETALAAYRRDKFQWSYKKPKYGNGGIVKALYDNRSEEDYLEDIYPEGYDEDSYSNIYMTERNIAYTLEEIEENQQRYLDEGHEGAMIKKRGNGADPDSKEYKNSQYVFNRTSNVMKHKPFPTEDGLCIGMKEGKGRHKGCAIFIVRDPRGNEIPVCPTGTLDQRKEWFENQEIVVGKKVTVKYQDLTVKNIWKFANVIAIRDYEPIYSKMKVKSINKKKNTFKVVCYSGSVLEVPEDEADSSFKVTFSEGDDTDIENLEERIVVIDFTDIEDPKFINIVKTKLKIVKKQAK